VGIAVVTSAHPTYQNPPSQSSIITSTTLGSTLILADDDNKDLTSKRRESFEDQKQTLLTLDVIQIIDTLLYERSIARWNGEYDRADALKEQLYDSTIVSVPVGWTLIIEDQPRSQGGQSNWYLTRHRFDNNSNNQDDYGEEEEEDRDATVGLKGPSILQQAHAALGFAVSCSQNQMTSSQQAQELKPIVENVKDKLRKWKLIHGKEKTSYSIWGDNSNLDSTPPQDQEAMAAWREVEDTLRGRKSADAAFWFALAGITDLEIFKLLADVCSKEIERFGMNPSCRIKDILQMLDRFAACGLDGHDDFERVSKECLMKKKSMIETTTTTDDSIRSTPTENLQRLDLHSDRCLVMLWKFAARQKKQQLFLQSAKIHWEQSRRTNHDNRQKGRWTEDDVTSSTTTTDTSNNGSHLRLDWSQCFDDPSRPLVVDIGCGMGISLLGLASDSTPEVSHQSKNKDDELIRLSSEHNFLGVDLSSLAIGYAKGVSHRRGLSGRLHYTVDTAESILTQIADTYPGPISLCLIQFPTPYRLSTGTDGGGGTGGGGNSQLPISALEGFMVSPCLLNQIHQILSSKSSHGRLLLQSNCEDVAVWMLQTAEDVGFESIQLNMFRTNSDMEELDQKMDLPQRTRNWIEQFSGERAVGRSWSALPLLPRRASTETEVACRLNGTPIHRCLVQPKAMKRYIRQVPAMPTKM